MKTLTAQKARSPINRPHKKPVTLKKNKDAVTKKNKVRSTRENRRKTKNNGDATVAPTPSLGNSAAFLAPTKRDVPHATLSRMIGVVRALALRGGAATTAEIDAQTQYGTRHAEYSLADGAALIGLVS